MLSIIVIDVLGFLCLILLGISLYLFVKYKELKQEENILQRPKKKLFIIKSERDVQRMGWDKAPILDEIYDSKDMSSKELPYGNYIIRKVEVNENDEDLLGF